MDSTLDWKKERTHPDSRLACSFLTDPLFQCGPLRPGFLGCPAGRGAPLPRCALKVDAQAPESGGEGTKSWALGHSGRAPILAPLWTGLPEPSRVSFPLGEETHLFQDWREDFIKLQLRCTQQSTATVLPAPKAHFLHNTAPFRKAGPGSVRHQGTEPPGRSRHFTPVDEGPVGRGGCGG